MALIWMIQIGKSTNIHDSLESPMFLTDAYPVNTNHS